MFLLFRKLQTGGLIFSLSISVFINSHAASDSATKKFDNLIWKTEAISALLRGPLAIASAKMEMDKKETQASRLRACANLIRLTNDLAATYNAFKGGDEKLFNYSPAVWSIFDLGGIISEFIGTSSNKDADESIDDLLSLLDGKELQNKKEDDREFSKAEQRLIVYVLPAIEWFASMCRASYAFDLAKIPAGVDVPWVEEFTPWLCNVAISGSRILSELIKSKSDSIEQKIAIGKAVACSAVILYDLWNMNFVHEASGKLDTPKTGDGEDAEKDAGKKNPSVPEASKPAQDSGEPKDSSSDILDIAKEQSHVADSLKPLADAGSPAPLKSVDIVEDAPAPAPADAVVEKPAEKIAEQPSTVEPLVVTPQVTETSEKPGRSSDGSASDDKIEDSSSSSVDDTATKAPSEAENSSVESDDSAEYFSADEPPFMTQFPPKESDGLVSGEVVVENPTEQVSDESPIRYSSAESGRKYRVRCNSPEGDKAYVVKDRPAKSDVVHTAKKS